MTTLQRLRRRESLERFFWLHWAPTYLRHMRHMLPIWRAARLGGIRGLVYWIILVVKALAENRQIIIRTGRRT